MPEPLSVHQRRVLGVLIEKQKTTDTYPLSLNSVATGCNQKSNRDPLLELDEAQVDDALVSLQKAGLVMRVVSGRVDKWRHLLYDAWKVTPVEIAILAELLLRGPQTEGELRARASRMEDIPDLETLRAALQPLKERQFVVYVTEENRRGSMLTHGFHDPAELERIRRHQPALPAEDQAPVLAPGLAERMRDLEVQLAALTQRVATLEQRAQP